MNAMAMYNELGHFPSVRDETNNNVSDSYIPKLWAFESIKILRENMVIGNLVHRDFSPMVQNFGDTVNTRKPAEFVAKRKGLDDSVTIQASRATNVSVKLDQHWHVSFMLRDGEMSKSFKNLVVEYLEPAILAETRVLDKVLLYQYPRFLANGAGQLGGLTKNNSFRSILDTRQVMNINKVPEGPGARNLIWTPYSETEALDTDIFLSADKVGDEGTALREAMLGRKLGFDHYMAQNTPFVDPVFADTVTGAVNNTGGYAKGYNGSITVDGSALDAVVGSYVSIAGDARPRRVTARTYTSPNTTAITLDTPLSAAVADDAVVTYAKTATVNLTGGYAAGYDKYIALDGFTSGKFLQEGQAFAVGTGASSVWYTVMDVQNASGTSQEVQLDRPLVADIADDAVIYPLPPGNYNLAFNRNAMTLVIRPLEAPIVPGVIAETINAGGFTIRVVISYNADKQGHMVTLDFLMGVELLDAGLGALLYG